MTPAEARSWDTWIFPWFRSAVIDAFETALAGEGFLLNAEAGRQSPAVLFTNDKAGIEFSYYAPEPPLHTTVILIDRSKQTFSGSKADRVPLWFLLDRDNNARKRFAALAWRDEAELARTLIEMRERFICSIALPTLADPMMLDQAIERFAERGG